MRQKVSPCASLFPQCIQNGAEDPATGVCIEVPCTCELYTAGLLELELRLVIMNRVTKNKAKEIAASAPNPASIVASVVVVVNVDVRTRGACVKMAVEVVTLISVMTE